MLDWAEPGKDPHARMLAWYRALVALRRAEPDLSDDDLRNVRVTTGPGRLEVHRGSFRVLVNLGPEAAEFEVPEGAQVVLAWTPPAAVPGGLQVAPDDVAVIRV